MLAGFWSVDNKVIGAVNNATVPVTGDVPHKDLVSGVYFFAAKLGVLRSRSSHIGEGRLVPNNFGNHIRYETGISAQLVIFGGVFVQKLHPTSDRVSGRVVTANDQQYQIAEVFHRVHVFCRFAMRQH